MRKQYSTTFKAKSVQEVLRGDKTISQIASEHDVHPNVIGLWKTTAIEPFPSLFERENADRDAERLAHDKQLRELYGEIGRLTTHVTFLKKNLVSSMSRPERVALIERADGELALCVQADLLGVSRSSLYYRPVAPAPAEIALKHRHPEGSREIYTAHPFYGSRRITAKLRRDEVVINRKAVQRHVQEMGIEAIGPRPHLSEPASAHRVFPYLLGDVVASAPNHVWGIDITSIRLAKGWLYLVAILDWFSRFVVAWELDQTLELDFVLAAVDRALTHATPVIWNSDQGSHFTSPRYSSVLHAADVRISMDGKRRALDNIFTERLGPTIKYEEVYISDDESPRAAHRGLSAYFDFYNHRRLNQALGYQTPAEVYFTSPRSSMNHPIAPSI